MPIRKHATIALVIAALAVPAMSASVLAVSAAPAFAKGPKGNGKGSSGNKGGNHAKPSKPSRGASTGNKGGNGNGKGSDASSNGLAVRTSAASLTASTEMHPSQLGSMNGALHASINAVLARIRNGNTNGPVGALAGLAVADHDAEGAQDVIDLAAQYEALASALEDAGFDSLAAYQEAVDAGDIETIVAVEEAKTALGEALDAEPPTEQDLADAEAALAAQQAAESSIVDAWNKSGDATEEETAALLQALRDRLNAESDAVAETVASIETASAAIDASGDETLPASPVEQ